MGCDIHAIVEVRNTDADPWKVYDLPDLERNYDIFGALVGGHPRARSVDGVIPARGLPKDMSEHSVYLGDHTYSWLSREETLVAFAAYRQDCGELGGRWLFLAYSFEFPEYPQMRLVFGFDS